MILLVTFLVWWAHSFPAIHRGDSYFIWAFFGILDILAGYSYRLTKISNKLSD